MGKPSASARALICLEDIDAEMGAYDAPSHVYVQAAWDAVT